MAFHTSIKWEFKLMYEETHMELVLSRWKEADGWALDVKLERILWLLQFIHDFHTSYKRCKLRPSEETIKMK